jgi:hypothetical protein
VNAHRRHTWVPYAYYYLAALIALAIVLTGVIRAVNATVDGIFFEPPQDQAEYYYGNDDRGDHFEDALQGVLSAAVGAPIFLWHLRQARRDEAANPGSPPATGRVA